MEFVPHFRNFLESGGARFRVTIGVPLAADSPDRKSVARCAHRAVETLGDLRAREDLSPPHAETGIGTAR